jgi:hypothetical protein
MRAPVGIVASARTSVPALPYLLAGAYVTTPDDAAFIVGTADFTLTAITVVPAATGASRFLLNHWGSVAADQAWLLYVTSTGTLQLNLRTTGNFDRGGVPLSASEVAALGADILGIGVSVTNLTGVPRIAALCSLDRGATWAEIGTPVNAASTWAPPGKDATIALGVGARATTGADRWEQPIYSAQMRSGSADPNAGGTVIARFDAAEYPGSGTSYVDPRGRTWTLSGAGVIVPG